MPEATFEREPLVSIVVVAYGPGLVLLEALDALAAHTPVAHEIIVVDNPAPGRESAASLLGDSSVPHLLLQPGENLGFAGGNELAVARARGTYVAFVNPDAIVTAGWLAPLLDELLADPTVRIAAPVLRGPDHELQEAGQILFDSGWTAAVGGPYVLPGDESQCFGRDVDYASAACWLVRRAEHVAIGGFDTGYHPAFYEDVDYALRTAEAGGVTRLVPRSEVVHLHGAGGAGRDRRAEEIAAVNVERFRSRWAARIAGSPRRPVDETGALAARDQACAATVAYVCEAGTSERLVAAHFDRARNEARARRRDRVMFIADPGQLRSVDVGSGRADGLDVADGPFDHSMAVRRSLVTEWRRAPRRGPVRRALAGLRRD